VKVRGYFVTGTDTGVGKTVVSVALLRLLAAQGLAVVGMKPVAAGCERHGNRLVNEDVEALHANSNVVAPIECINPYAFAPPIAPHIAAEQAGTRIALAPMRSCFDALAHLADMVVVEGAGGLLVPLNESETMADLALALGVPLILVVGMRLGCINHALLTAEAITRRRLVLAGWVANRIDPHMASFDANLAALKRRIPAPLLGVIPHFSGPIKSFQPEGFIQLPPQ